MTHKCENDESADRGIVEHRKCGSRCDSSGDQRRSCRETMLQLHFTNDTLPDNVSTDFQNLSKFSEQQFVSLTEILYQFLLEPKESERFLRQLTEFAGENGMSAGPLRALMKSVLLLPHGALKRNLTAEQVKADLLSLGLNEDKASHFSDQWRIHYPVLSRLAVGQTLMVNQLVDMEWKFGVTVGTSELQKTGNIFLQLKLVIRKGNTTENVYMELTLPQFYNFLHEMERAKASMDCFS
uniref:COMM domain-containing protein 7-like n=2 Tax=Sinocyclocheilus grahami TaxID=75366 RepID=A0A672QVQ1_SINGR